MLIRGDARLLPLLDGCVDCVVTSPPYFGLRDYGTARWEGGDAECEHNARSGDLRFTHPISDKQRSNAGSAGSAGDVCVKCGAARRDSQIGLESTPDAYVQSLVSVFAEVWRVLKDCGTVWLNIGDSYSGSGDLTRNDSIAAKGLCDLPRQYRLSKCDLKPKNLIGIPWRVAFALQAAGWYLRSDIVWSKPNPMPENVTDRPTKAHEYVFLLAKRERYWYDVDAIREPHADSSLARYEYGLHATPANALPDSSRARFQAGLGSAERMGDFMNDNGRNKRTVWTVPTQPYAGAHFATMPEALVEPCILAGCPLGGLVLDPFVGSGTVVGVAERLGRRGVGVDLTYQDLSKARTAQRGIRFDAVTKETS